MNSDPPFAIACFGLETLHTASRPRGPLSPRAGKSEVHRLDRAGAITERSAEEQSSKRQEQDTEKNTLQIAREDAIISGTAPYGARSVHFIASH